jgi:hypothetical protein
MKFVYTTQEAQPYDFEKLGGYLKPDMTVELTDAAYQRFREQTAHTTDTLVLIKQESLNG